MLVDKKCDFCGITFKKRSDHLAGREKFFCNRQCFYDFKQRKFISELSDIQNQVIEGSLLGDGSIPLPQTPDGKIRNCRFLKTQKSDRADYIFWTSEILGDLSASVSFRKQLKPTRVGDHVCHFLVPNTGNSESINVASVCHEIFTKLRGRWYVDGKKIVPEDFSLTPLSLAIWFCDDGSNCLTQGGKVTFSTNSFSFKDCEILKSELEKLGIQSNIVGNKRGPEINIMKKSYDDFLDIVSPHVVWDCFQYKIAKPEVFCKKCHLCDKAFRSRDDRKRFCSKVCSSRFMWDERRKSALA